MPTDSPFDRTEVIPTGSSRGAGYVRDDAEWIERCLARVLELDAVLKPEEASAVVRELATRERWRVMAPEAVADQLYTKPPTRGAG
jgi:hypothetical protein